MTETITSMSSIPKKAMTHRPSSSAATLSERAATAQLVKAARERGEESSPARTGC